jgi:hypothetical protein
MKNGWATRWPKLQMKKRELSNHEFRSFPLPSDQKAKESFGRELLNPVRQCNW